MKIMRKKDENGRKRIKKKTLLIENIAYGHIALKHRFPYN